VYATGVMLWEALTGRKLFFADGDFAIADQVRTGAVPAPSTIAHDVTSALDAIVLRATAKSPDDRFATAAEMAAALERDVGVATPSEVAAWVVPLAGQVLKTRERTLADIEQSAPQWAPTATRGADADPDGLAPTRAIDVSPQGEATEVSLSSAVVAAPPRSRTWVWVAAGAVVLVTSLGVGSLALFSSRHAARARLEAEEASASTSASIAAAPIEPASVASESSAPPAATIELPPVVDVAPAVSTPDKPAHAARVLRDPCRPPYVIDSRGIRHLKRECLR